MAFLRMHDSSPRSSPPPSPVCKLPLFLTASWQKRGAGVGYGAKSYNRKKAWPSINSSILSDKAYRESAGFERRGVGGREGGRGHIWSKQAENLAEWLANEVSCQAPYCACLICPHSGMRRQHLIGCSRGEGLFWLVPGLRRHTLIGCMDEKTDSDWMKA